MKCNNSKLAIIHYGICIEYINVASVINNRSLCMTTLCREVHTQTIIASYMYRNYTIWYMNILMQQVLIINYAEVDT